MTTGQSSSKQTNTNNIIFCISCCRYFANLRKMAFSIGFTTLWERDPSFGVATYPTRYWFVDMPKGWLWTCGLSSCEVGPHFCWLNTTPEKLKQGFTASSSNASGVEPLLNIISYPYGLVVSCSFTYINISGKLTVCYGKSPFLRDKSTISMAMSTKKKPPNSYAPWGVLPELRDIRGRCDCRRRSRCHDHPHTPPVKRAKRPKNGGW